MGARRRGARSGKLGHPARRRLPSTPMIWLLSVAYARTVHLEFDPAAWEGGASGECSVDNSLRVFMAWTGPCTLRVEPGADGQLSVSLVAQEGRRSPLRRLPVAADGRSPPLTPENRDSAWWWEQVVGRWAGADLRAPGTLTSTSERAFPALGWAPAAVVETTTVGARVPCAEGLRARCVWIELRVTPDATAYLQQLQNTWNAAPNPEGLHDQPVSAAISETWTVLTELRTLRPWQVTRRLDTEVAFEGGAAANARLEERIRLDWSAR